MIAGSLSSATALVIALFQAASWYSSQPVTQVVERIVPEPQVCQCECIAPAPDPASEDFSFAPYPDGSFLWHWSWPGLSISLHIYVWVVVGLTFCLFLSLSIIRCCLFLLIRSQTHQNASIQTLQPLLSLAYVQATPRTCSVGVQTESSVSPPQLPSGLEGLGGGPVTPSRLRAWRAQQQVV